MKRSTFIKNFALLTTGGVVFNCRDDSFKHFLEPNSSGNLTLDEAQAWFTEHYLKKYESTRKLSALTHKRLPNWDDAKEVKSLTETSYIIVPIKYEGNGRPCFMSWNDETAFRTKLTEYFAYPIFEALIIHTDDKGNKEAYLSQIAYDRYYIKDGIFNLDTFTGWFLKSEWDDTLIEGQFYSGGKHELTLNSKNSGNRIVDCELYYFAYYTYEGYSCGVNCSEIVITQHRTYFLVCSGGGGGGGGYPYAAPGGGGPGNGGGEGNFTIPEFAPDTTNYNLKEAICNSGGTDRWQMSQNLSNALTATGLTTGVAGWTFDKADAIIRAIGGSNLSYNGVMNIAGKVLGGANFAIGSVQAFVGLTDGDISDSDMLNLLGVAVGGVGLLATGWVAVAIGGVSLGIAIYQNANTPGCN